MHTKENSMWINFLIWTILIEEMSYLKNGTLANELWTLQCIEQSWKKVWVKVWKKCYGEIKVSKLLLNVTFHIYKLLKSLLINNMPGMWCLLRKVGNKMGLKNTTLLVLSLWKSVQKPLQHLFSCKISTCSSKKNKCSSKRLNQMCLVITTQTLLKLKYIIYGKNNDCDHTDFQTLCPSLVRETDSHALNSSYWLCHSCYVRLVRIFNVLIPPLSFKRINANQPKYFYF